jgi:alginate O-acetyltransferase complex protein AlgI
VAWGIYHGLLLSGYRRFSPQWDSLPIVMQRVGTFVLVIFGWTLFRSPDFSTAVAMLSRMLVPHAGEMIVGAPVLAVFLVLAGILAHAGPNTGEMKHEWRPATALALAAGLLFCMVRIYSSDPSPFLYFQF